jgi:hypothetical protein
LERNLTEPGLGKAAKIGTEVPVIMIGCGHCSVPDEWGISIDLGRSPPIPPASKRESGHDGSRPALSLDSA